MLNLRKEGTEMSFGSRLQAIRRQSGLTQEAFAQQLNVTRQAVSKWESSRGYPEVEKILYICKLYGVSPDELFQDEIPRPETEAEAPPLHTPPLKESLGNFFSNLSPHHQWSFGVTLSSAGMVLLVLFCLLCTTVAKGESDSMTMKIIWLALLILFGAGEAVTVGLTSIWFAVGALGALICALLGAQIWLQIAVFLLLSALALALMRPLARRFLTPGYSATNADRVIGSTTVVIQEIDNLKGRGQVKIADLEWSARSEHGEIIPVGTEVTVLRIEGVKVFVEKKEN